MENLELTYCAPGKWQYLIDLTNLNTLPTEPNNWYIYPTKMQTHAHTEISTGMFIVNCL